MVKHFPGMFVLDYILAQVNDGECPYVKVTIFGREFFGLLDSGANKVFVNDCGWLILESLGMRLDHTRQVSCMVADGNESLCLGVASVPICLRNVVKIIDVYVMPRLRHTLVLGIRVG